MAYTVRLSAKAIFGADRPFWVISWRRSSSRAVQGWRCFTATAFALSWCATMPGRLSKLWQARQKLSLYLPPRTNPNWSYKLKWGPVRLWFTTSGGATAVLTRLGSHVLLPAKTKEPERRTVVVQSHRRFKENLSLPTGCKAGTSRSL